MENLVTISDGKVVVSSRQVAEKFRKEHKHVMESIRGILAVENSATKLFSESTFDNRGKQYPEYLMNRDGFTLLAMGFTGADALQWKLRYIQAFNAMEEQLRNTHAIPQTYADALLLAAQQAKALEVASPKAEYFDALVDRGLSLSFRETAKDLGIRERKFIQWLLENGYVYRDAKEKLVPYAKYCPRYFVSKEYKSEEHTGTQTLITVAGRDYFRKKL